MEYLIRCRCCNKAIDYLGKIENGKFISPNISSPQLKETRLEGLIEENEILVEEHNRESKVISKEYFLQKKGI